MILLIDNYDSFSYNLVQLIGVGNSDIKVVRNDELNLDDIRTMAPSHIILSPGPGRPEDAGICEDVIRHLGKEFPILGVCLGHQAICEVFGATITYAKTLMHGKQSIATLDTECDIFKGISQTTPVARYHSLAADADTIPDSLRIIATTEDGEVMGIRHQEYPIYGLQFHPESVLTPEGQKMLDNFIAI